MGSYFINLDALAILRDFLPNGKASPVDFTVGVILCEYMGNKDTCWPTREEISQRSGIRRIATISAAISRLVKIGFIDRERTQHGVRYRLRHDILTISDVAPTATPENPDVAPTATPENDCDNSRRSTRRTSDVAYVATSYTYHKNNKENIRRTKNFTCPREEGEERGGASESLGKPSTPKPESTPPALELVSPKGKNIGGTDVPPPAGAKGKADGKVKAKKPPTPKASWDGKMFTVPDVLMDAWRTAYPGVDLTAQLKKAAAWCVSNPRKSPKSDFTRFLNGWLSRSEPTVIAASPAPSGSTGEAKRMAQYFKKDTDVRYDW